LSQILKQGQARGVFQPHDAEQSAAAIKALLQDWYVKRWKFARRGTTVDAYADFVVDFVMAFQRVATQPAPPEEHVRHELN
jgi:hypothetical protein